MDWQTPAKKQNKDEEIVDKNEICNIPYTSGQKIRMVMTNRFGSHREIRTQLIIPMRSIMAQQQTNPTNPQLLHGEKDLTQQITMIKQRYETNGQVLKHHQSSIQQLKAKAKELISSIHHKKRLTQIYKERFASIKKGNFLITEQTEHIISNTRLQIFQVKDFIKSQEQGLYSQVGKLFGDEKLKLELKAQIAQKSQRIYYDERLNKEKNQYIERIRKETNRLDEEKWEIDDQLQKSKSSLKINQVHVAVLKMQINPHLKVSFETFCSDISGKKSLLNKNEFSLKKKIKPLSKRQIKFFILIQLYPSWRKILGRVSFHFVGYRQLFFQHDNFEKGGIENFYDYIKCGPNQLRNSTNKIKSYIVFYSCKEQRLQNLIEILSELKGLDNGIICIEDVQFIKTERQNIQEMHVNYTLNHEKRTKTFEIVRLSVLNRETLLPYIPKGGDKISLIKLEVPLVLETAAEKAKIEQVYRMIERYK